MYNYPAGVTQASFDRETERLNSGQRQFAEEGPIDERAMLRLEMSLHPERFMRKTDATKIVRVLMALERQVSKAEPMSEDWKALCRTIGRTMAENGLRCWGEL